MEEKIELFTQETRKYSYKLKGKEAFELFLEDSLNLVENPPQNTEEIFLGSAYELPFGGRLFAPTPCFLDEGYISHKICFSRKIKAHGKTIIRGYYRDYLKKEEIADFLRDFFDGNILFEETDIKLIIEPFGWVKYKMACLFRDKLIFRGKGDLNINSQENLEKLASYYRLVK